MASEHAALYILIRLLQLFFLQANKKTRNRAYDILVQIGHACGDEEKGGNRENLFQFFKLIEVMILFNGSFRYILECQKVSCQGSFFLLIAVD
jgi:hypothetical protein